jgi:flagellar motor protein MotB
MSLYYDTAAPTPSTKNSITRTATDFGIRDFLLHKNIQNPIRYPFLSTSINGSPRGGEPYLDTMVGTGVVLPQVSLEVAGIPRYNTAVLPNRFKNTDPTAPSILDINDIPTIPIFPVPPNGTVNYQQQDISQFGLLAKSNFKEYRKFNTIKNLYVDAPKQIDMADFISIQPVVTGQQLSSYLDEYGGLNLGDRNTTQAADIIGSILNGQGIGISSGGLVTNFDIRASLAGRVLGATGLLKDTKLGIIGGQQLALSLANNAAFNTQQAILGTLNVRENILSLVKDGSLTGFRPNYKITVPSSIGGQILNTAGRILGFTIPRSYLSDAGSLFSSENDNVDNITRANAMIENTGTGQVAALLKNVRSNVFGTSSSNDSPSNDTISPFRSGYVPGYLDNKGQKMIDPIGYAFMSTAGTITNFIRNTNNDVIPELNWNREKLVEKEGFQRINRDFTWVSESNVDTTNNTLLPNQPINTLGSLTTGAITPETIKGNKKSLLVKTQKLFNSVGMKNIVSTRGDMTNFNLPKLTTKSSNADTAISKGSAVLSGLALTGSTNKAEDVFCRTWTRNHQYKNYENLIRRRGLNKSEIGNNPIYEIGSGKNGGWRRNSLQGSVLDDNGIVKITPYKGEDLTRNASTPKRYMFSIENLAWAGTPAANLLPCEQGPGDLLSGKFGKIMWFPPYNLSFSESNSVNLETTNFIGRGEPIYTYNNTERTGNLSFSLIVDHPSIVNAFKNESGPDEDFIRSWFAGCVDLDSQWVKYLTEEEKVRITKKVQKPRSFTIQPIKTPDEFKIYFKNDRSDIDFEYESGVSQHAKLGQTAPSPGVGDYQADTKYTRGGKNLVWPDNKDFGLNSKSIKIEDTTYLGWISPGYFEDLKTFMVEKCPTCKIFVDGHASDQGFDKTNKLLSDDRAKSVKALLESYGIPNVNLDLKGSNEVFNGAYNSNTPVDEEGPKKDRYARIRIVNEQKAIEVPLEPEIVDEDLPVTLNNQVKNRFYTECDFFEKIKETDSFIYDKFKQKIKYFHPAFHSTTPEGFNSRLTFLLQCTRQGATMSNVGPKNLAFGPAPVCILRIGDFYNTKIMIDNVNIEYEPLVWDLNPEGIGVQPMIANVTISFKYIGGSSLEGPINKLQNALSFNYFANTQTFDPRADSIAIKKDDKGNTVNRTTLGTKNDKESSYALVPGLDPSKDVMGALNLNEVDANAAKKNNTNGLDEVKASENANNQSSKTPPLKDIERIQLNNVSSSVANFGPSSNVTFDISRKFSQDNLSLNKDYDLTVKIVNNTNSTSWSVKIPNKLKASTTGVQPFNFDLINMTPACNGLDLTANSYNFIVTVGDAGTLNYTIPKIGNTPTPATNNQTTQPKITGFKIVEIDRIVGSDSKRIITVQLNQEGLFKQTQNGYEQIVSDEVLKEFVNKGIKIVLDATPIPTSASRHEQVIQFDGPSYCNGERIFRMRSFLGSPSNDYTALVDIPIMGNYILSVYYAGQKISSLNVEIGYNQFRYSN